MSDEERARYTAGPCEYPSTPCTVFVREASKCVRCQLVPEIAAALSAARAEGRADRYVPNADLDEEASELYAYAMSTDRADAEASIRMALEEVALRSVEREREARDELWLAALTNRLDHGLTRRGVESPRSMADAVIADVTAAIRGRK